MRTLLVLRHAKSSHADESLPDHDRPLTERGRRDAPRMGMHLLERDLVPDDILCSSAQRTTETAELAAEACHYRRAIRSDERLYLASCDGMLRLLVQQSERVKRLLLVGHNPGLEDLVERLTGRRETLSTAALAHIEIPIDSWDDVASTRGAALKGLWRPRDLDEPQ